MLATSRNVDLAKKTTADIDYRIASTQSERAAAFRLVYRSYLEAGLGEPNRQGMRVTPYHLLPTTEVFLASIEQEAVFTMSLVTDGRLGLPMESIYADVVHERRQQGLLVGEVSCLADRRDHSREFFPVFLRLSRLLAQYAWRRGVDQLLVAVHPRHARFYRRLLAFDVIGEQRSYPTVRDHPAVPLALDLAKLHRTRCEAFQTLFSQRLPAEQLQPQPITPAETEYFGAAVDPSFTSAPLAGSSKRAGQTVRAVA